MNGKKIGGWIVRDGFAAVMNVGQTYTVKHIQKGLTLFDLETKNLQFHSPTPTLNSNY